MSDRPLVEQAHAAVALHLPLGAAAVDATVGNGRDTLFLARCVGPSGRVFGFDVQSTALATARHRLSEAGVAGQVTLLHSGHERLAELLPPPLHGQVAAVMFNLGYLPRGDKRIVTAADTTLAALSAAGDLLAPGGCISVIAYTGHPGGREEADAVRAWAAALPAERFSAKIVIPDRPRAPEWIFVIRADAPTRPRGR